MATTVNVATDDGDMGLYDAEPEGAPAWRRDRAAGGVRGQRPHRGRDPPVRGRRATGPWPPTSFTAAAIPMLDYGNFEKIMPHMQALSEAGLLERPRRHPRLPGRRRLRRRPGGRGRFLHGRVGHLPGRRPSGPGRGRHLLRRGSGRGPLRDAARWWRWPPACRRRGSVCSATRTRASPSTRWRRCARRRPRRRCRPRSSATPAPATVFTATPGPTRITRRRPSDGWSRTLDWFERYLAAGWAIRTVLGA